jgi:hypothetical protein
MMYQCLLVNDCFPQLQWLPIILIIVHFHVWQLQNIFWFYLRSNINYSIKIVGIAIIHYGVFQKTKFIIYSNFQLMLKVAIIYAKLDEL